MSKLFFEVEAMNVSGYTTTAHIAFSAVTGISDFNFLENNTADKAFLENVKCIMMTKDGHQLFCIEARPNLVARIEREKDKP